MKSIAVVLQAAGALLAVVPGVAMFLTGAFAPPSLGQVFGAVATVSATLLVLALFLKKHRIASMREKRVRRRLLLYLGMGVTSLVLFAYFRQLCVQPYELIFQNDPTRPRPVSELTHRDTVYMPLILTGKLKQYVREAGGRSSAVDEQGPAKIDAVVRETPGLLLLTTVMLLALYVAANLSVVAAILLLGIRASAQPTDG